MTVRIRWRLRQPAPAAFVHPFEEPRRTAILIPGFRKTRLTRTFPEGWCEIAAQWKPEVIAGSIQQLEQIAALREPPGLTHAIVALARENEHLLRNEQRNLLWKQFGVPIFEQLLGPQNELLASECDAHAGLHVRAKRRHILVDEEPCPCGDPSPLLLRIEPVAEWAA